MKDDWSYNQLKRILEHELPMTMTLGLLQVLVKKMVQGRFFKEPVEGLVATVKTIAEKAQKTRKK
jgi:hypothetical protein